jgi:rare lipoprotein A
MSVLLIGQSLAPPALAQEAMGSRTPAEQRKPTHHNTRTARQHVVQMFRGRRHQVAAAVQHATPATIAFGDDTPIRPRPEAMIGLASWYGGPRWQGKRTSSGGHYDQDALTAAHATLPLGSRVLVRVVGSDRNVVVTINDRPGTRQRIIDLSRAAAKQLGILTCGVAVVMLTPL